MSKAAPCAFTSAPLSMRNLAVSVQPSKDEIYNALPHIPPLEFASAPFSIRNLSVSDFQYALWLIQSVMHSSILSTLYIEICSFFKEKLSNISIGPEIMQHTMHCHIFCQTYLQWHLCDLSKRRLTISTWPSNDALCNASLYSSFYLHNAWYANSLLSAKSCPILSCPNLVKSDMGLVWLTNWVFRDEALQKPCTAPSLRPRAATNTQIRY